MHKSVQDYVQKWATELGLTAPDKRIIEFGSYNENGTVRDMFKGEYIGVDMRQGPGVNIVHNTNDPLILYWPYSYSHCVLWLETMEHDLFFWKTLDNIKLLMGDGGYVIATTRGTGFPLHNYPSDYYRFTVASFNELFKSYGFEVIDIQLDPQKDHPGVFGVFKLG